MAWTSPVEVDPTPNLWAYFCSCFLISIALLSALKSTFSKVYIYVPRFILDVDVAGVAPLGVLFVLQEGIVDIKQREVISFKHCKHSLDFVNLCLNSFGILKHVLDLQHGGDGENFLRAPVLRRG